MIETVNKELINALQAFLDVAPSDGRIETVLLQGHPTKADLACGMGAKRGLPVSSHNVWCDKRCGEEARKYLKEGEVECRQ